jgi:hypothetical protein
MAKIVNGLGQSASVIPKVMPQRNNTIAANEGAIAVDLCFADTFVQG